MKKEFVKKRIFIGISGPSGSGKTTICENIKEKFNSQIIYLDNYWKDPRNFPILQGRKNWELPGNLNFTQLYDHLMKLKNGQTVNLDKRVYGIHLNKTTVKPSKVMIVEGFLLFYDKRIRDIIDYKIYIDVPDEEIIKRRMNRDRRSKIPDEFYYRKIVVKEYKKYGLPTKKYANLVIDGMKPINQIIIEIENEIKKFIQ